MGPTTHTLVEFSLNPSSLRDLGNSRRLECRAVGLTQSKMCGLRRPLFKEKCQAFWCFPISPERVNPCGLEGVLSGWDDLFPAKAFLLGWNGPAAEVKASDFASRRRLAQCLSFR